MTKKQCDDLWSKAVKILAGFRCEYCYSTRVLNSHHFYGKRYRATRYDINNGFCLCCNHHINLAHQRPADFVTWAIQKRGELWMTMLRIKSRKVKLDTSLDLIHCKQICDQYEKIHQTT